MTSIADGSVGIQTSSEEAIGFVNPKPVQQKQQASSTLPCSGQRT